MKDNIFDILIESFLNSSIELQQMAFPSILKVIQDISTKKSDSFPKFMI